MIDKLTASQEALLKEYRDKVFGYATSTVTDKPKAEAAVLRLTEDVLVGPEIHWSDNVWDACKIYRKYSDLSLPRDFYADSYIYSKNYDIERYLRQIDIEKYLWQHTVKYFQDVGLGGKGCTFDSTLYKAVFASLWERERDLDIKWSAGPIAYFRYMEKAGLADYDKEESERLLCLEDLLCSCFAMFVCRNHIVLLEKPKRVKVDDGKLVEIEW